MRSLIIGILLFLIWSILATWYYTAYIYPPESKTIEEPTAESYEPTEETLTSEVVEPPSPPDPLLVFFDFNRTDFVPDQKIQDFMEKGKAFILADTSVCIEITGHTDSKGSDAYNLKLGQLRANSIRDYFLQMGFSRPCMKISSMGETEPAADNGTEEGRAKNRRVVIEIQSK